MMVITKQNIASVHITRPRNSTAGRIGRSQGDSWRGERSLQYTRDKILCVFRREWERMGTRSGTVSTPTGKNRWKDWAQNMWGVKDHWVK